MAEEPLLAENPVEEPVKEMAAVEPKPTEKVSEFVPEFIMVEKPKDARTCPQSIRSFMSHDTCPTAEFDPCFGS